MRSAQPCPQVRGPRQQELVARLREGDAPASALNVSALRALVERGAVGKVYMLKQAEKHSGPHSAWFYKEECAGGGVMMDMAATPWPGSAG